MRTLFIFGIAMFLNYSLAIAENHRITCNDIKNVSYIGKIFVDWSSNETKEFDVKFYLSTNPEKNLNQIDLKNRSQLVNYGFDVSKKTFIIIHGYFSNVQQDWVLVFKDTLLQLQNCNVILVDWSEGSKKKNYVNAAKNTVLASQHIFNFLQSLRVRVRNLKGSSGQNLWNHLHFIGHSLGAHVSGQTAHLLKNKKFWKVDRITGLDPAKPCFSNVDASLRVDRKHANFVDIYHTQIGLGYTKAYGLEDSLGHVDFYLNGGLVQPKCERHMFPADTMICSHTLVTEYFYNAIWNALHTESVRCQFPIRQWNGSYLDAQNQMNFMKQGLNCNDCPKMGMDAINSKMRGVFLVLTGSKPPYCNFNLEEGIRKVKAAIKKLKNIRSIFDHRPADRSVRLLADD